MSSSFLFQASLDKEKKLEIYAVEENVNFLADGGRALKESLAADAESSRKLAEALQIFDEMEQRTKELLRKELSSN